MKKKITAAVLAAVLALSLAACAPAADPSQVVVATVNGTNITQDRLDAMVDATAQLYAMMGLTTLDDFYANEESLNNVKSSLLNSLITSELLLQKARELGMSEYTEQEKADKSKEAQDYLEQLKQLLQPTVDQEAASDANLDKEARLNELLDQQLAMMGTSAKNYVSDYIKSEELTRAQEFLTSEVVMSDDDLKAYFEKKRDEQKTQSETSPATIYNLYNEGTLFYSPENARLVKHILVKIPDEATASATNLYSTDPKAALESIEGELEKIMPKVEEIMKKIEAGEDFDALMEQYGEDPGMKASPGKEVGYLIYDGSKQFYDEFTQAGLALKNPGDVSEPTATVNGYHIIKYFGAPTVPETYADMSDANKNQALEETKSAYLNEKLTQWTNESKIETFLNK